jgi:ABC-type antimicrobial peptide transport system permease subunit
MLVAIGAVLGIAAAAVAARSLAGLLYGVSPIDPITFAAAPVFLAAATLAACLRPARAASRVDPADVLRSE